MKPSTFIVLMLLLLAGSCTVEKRTFNRGYHVSWNKSFRDKTAAESEDQLAKEEITEETAEKEELVAVVPKDEQASSGATDDLKIESIESVEQLAAEEQILAESPTANPDTVYFYPKFEPNGIASFSCGLAGVATLFWAITSGMYGFLFLMFLLLITGLILGLSSLSRYKISPGRYRTNVFGVLGVIINALGLGLMLFGLIGLIAFFLSF